MIKVIESQPLQTIKFNSNMSEEIQDLLDLAFERNASIAWVLRNKSFSSSLKLKWLSCYLKEWNEKIDPVSKSIRQKLCVANKVITIDLKENELIILDLDLDVYKTICEENDYLIQIRHKQMGKNLLGA